MPLTAAVRQAITAFPLCTVPYHLKLPSLGHSSLPHVGVPLVLEGVIGIGHPQSSCWLCEGCCSSTGAEYPTAHKSEMMLSRNPTLAAVAQIWTLNKARDASQRNQARRAGTSKLLSLPECSKRQKNTFGTTYRRFI